MDWVSILTQGGGWTVGIFFGWCVGTGRLVLKREVDQRDARITELKETLETTIKRLDDAHATERESLRQSNLALQTRVEALVGRLDNLAAHPGAGTGGR